MSHNIHNRRRSHRKFLTDKDNNLQIEDPRRQGLFSRTRTMLGLRFALAFIRFFSSELVVVIVFSIFIILKVILKVILIFRLARLQDRTPADDGRGDEITQFLVVDEDDAEVETGLEDEQEVGVDVEIAEEDDRRAVNELAAEREHLERKNDSRCLQIFTLAWSPFTRSVMCWN